MTANLTLTMCRSSDLYKILDRHNAAYILDKRMDIRVFSQRLQDSKKYLEINVPIIQSMIEYNEISDQLENMLNHDFVLMPHCVVVHLDDELTIRLVM